MSEQLSWPPRKEDLQRLYVERHLSAMRIANVYGLKYASPKTAESTVLYHLKRNGIVRRDAADHVRKVSPAMVDEWIRRYQNGESLKRIAGKEVDAVTVWNHLKARGIILRDKVEAQIKAVSKYDRRPFDGNEVERAYLTGLRYGDLNVVRHGRAIRVRVSTTHPAMAELFEALFSPYGHVFRYPRRAELTGFEWSLECDLDHGFGFLLEKARIDAIDSLSAMEFFAFLAGFFDAEGSIYLHWKSSRFSPELSLSNTDDPLLRCINERLVGVGISPNLRQDRQREGRIGGTSASTIWKVKIWRFEDVKRLLVVLGFKHSEKLEKKRLALGLTQPPMTSTNLEIWKKWDDLGREIRRGCQEFIRRAEIQVSRFSLVSASSGGTDNPVMSKNS